MSKILIIGVGDAGRNTVKHMKDSGMPDTDFVTFGAFEDCDNLQTIPVGLFDKNTNVTNFGGYSSSDYFSGTFSGCSNITGESPYTVINVDGQDVKVHLYERANYPDYFTAPARIYNCYNNN